ncbi:MAG: pyridoxamine 5'-phosphate oxidase family protein [Bacillota bacterium]
MDQATREFVQHIIEHARDLTLATIRPDGYPQATTVSYANDGLTIYIGIGKDSQKANNIRHCNKVSLTINEEYDDWKQIKGVSMGALAEILTDAGEIRHATELMLKRYPQMEEWVQTDNPTDVVLLKVTPQVISVLNYEKGFGHTELVTAP